MFFLRHMTSQMKFGASYMTKCFTQSELQAIADALGDTSDGLTGAEIANMLASCGMSDPSPEMAKRHRIYNSFAAYQNGRQDRSAILAFIRRSMKPAAHARKPERFEPMRSKLNVALSFIGLAVDEAGKLISVKQARTLSEAQNRANELRSELELRKVHPDVLRFCRKELLVENYFHAILEATKSVADKLRMKTGLTDDGGILVDRSLGGDLPFLAINPLRSESEKSEQKGFANLVKGTFGMFRNTTAHSPKIVWAVNRGDAEEVFNLLSLIHKRLDSAVMPPRA
jgi:uncharacterized protein (TIGR02391 family)